MFRFGLSWITS